MSILCCWFLLASSAKQQADSSWSSTLGAQLLDHQILIHEPIHGLHMIIPALTPNSLFVNQSHFMVFEVWASKGRRWWLVEGGWWWWWWWWYRRQSKTTHGVGRRGCRWETKCGSAPLGHSCGRQVGDNHADRSTQSIRGLGDKETSLKSCGQTNRECSRRQLGDKCEDQSAQSIQTTGRQGDKWETSLKSCGQRTGRESRVYWETTGRQAWNHAGREPRV